MMTTMTGYPPPMTSDEPQQWLSRAQAAERLGVSTQTIDNWVRLGKLDRYKLAGRRLTRFKAEDVEALYRATAASPDGTDTDRDGT